MRFAHVMRIRVSLGSRPAWLAVLLGAAALGCDAEPHFQRPSRPLPPTSPMVDENPALPGKRTSGEQPKNASAKVPAGKDYGISIHQPLSR